MFGESLCISFTMGRVDIRAYSLIFYRVYFKHLPVVINMTYYFVGPSQQRVVSREKMLSKCFFYLPNVYNTDTTKIYHTFLLHNM